MLRIALPNKGRLAEDARELFNDAGLEIRAAGARALTASLGGEFQALFVRAQDIPEFVADGAADAGVTGWDLVRESGRDLDDLADLDFGRCRLAVAAKEDSGIAQLEAARRPARASPPSSRASRRRSSRRAGSAWRSCRSPAPRRSRRTSGSPTSSWTSSPPAPRSG